jgi:hypothetical protein
MGYARVIHNKKKRKYWKKNGLVSELSKQWVLRCPPEKRKK